MAESGNPASNGAAPAEGTQTAQLTVQKLYVKDASFEAPNAPQIFNEQAQPQLQLNMAQKVANLGTNVYEVVLTLTLTCIVEEKTAYLAEVQQAGIFTVGGFDARNLDAVLGTYCPNTLFPYARQVISEMVQNGGFPPYFLQPINFDQLYAEQLRRRAAQQQEAGASATDEPSGNA
jgi:preprotein translocase subunit SecB